MRLHFLLLVAGCLGIAAEVRADQPPRSGHAARAAADQRPTRLGLVGSVYIIGNEATPQDVILDQVDLSPGQPFTDADLRRFEKNLARLSWLFVVDGKDRPIVWVKYSDQVCDFKDIVVQIKERPFTPHVFRAAEYLQGAAWEMFRYPRLGLWAAIPGVTAVPDRLTAASFVIADALCRGNWEDAYQASVLFAYSCGLIPISPAVPAQMPAPRR